MINKESIVHFVGFVTNLELQDFAPIWETLINNSTINSGKGTLEEIDRKQKSIFAYISRYSCNPSNFSFAFMKERNRAGFQERKPRIVQTGGYMPVQFTSCLETTGLNKIIAFIPDGEKDLTFYHQQDFHHLNIYEAYFENCSFSYIMDFFVREQHTEQLLAQLNTRPATQSALYTDRLGAL